MMDVIVVKTDTDHKYYCPNCTKRLRPRGKWGCKRYNELNYCDNCGTKLNWSKTGVY